MPFDPALPLEDSEMRSAEMRNQFNGLNDKIDALPAPPTLISQLTNDAGYLTNPGSIDLANRWLKDQNGNTTLEWGYNTNALTINGTIYSKLGDHKSANFNERKLAFGEDGSGVIQTALAWDTGGPLLYSRGGDVVYLALNADARQLVASDGVTVAATWADGALKDGAGNAFSTGAYSPANAGHWAGSAPATLAAALDRLADVVSNAGATPIP